MGSELLQSLFTWIFYLFKAIKHVKNGDKVASILIHLDFLSIQQIYSQSSLQLIGFNPYSPGFSIYLLRNVNVHFTISTLQSLFTWIFYLFYQNYLIFLYKEECFNPYSPGFSIYFQKLTNVLTHEDGFNPYSPGFSIYLEYFIGIELEMEKLQSLFTWIFYLFYDNNYSTAFNLGLQSLFTWIFYLF